MDKNELTAPERQLIELGNSEFEVAKGDADIRGWKVKDIQGNTVGEVRELLCDPAARKARYLIVDLEKNALNLEPTLVLIPMERANLRAASNSVTVPHASASRLRALPPYHRGTFLDQETETQVQQVWSADFGTGAPLSFSREQVPAADNRHESANPFDASRPDAPQQRVQNVIGLFQDAGTVQRVTQALESQGFSREQIEVAVRQTASGSKEKAFPNFEQFYTSLFTSPAEAAQHQAKVNYSNALVVVHARSTEEAQAAARIVDGFISSELNIQVEPTDASATAYAQQAIHSSPAAYQNDQKPAAEQTPQDSRAAEFQGEENQPRPEDQIRIERLPINRPTIIGDFASFQEGTIELIEHAEVPIITKEAFVVEEITVGKDVEVHEEIIQETIRHTEVQIEELRPTSDRSTTPNTASGTSPSGNRR